ncbi:MAG: hypothetical protein ABEH86_10540 [Haloarcula sp.]
MSQARNIRTNEHERGFLQDALSEARRFDLALIAAVPVLLLAVYALPQSRLEGLVFNTTAPSLVTAYASHFVHLDGFHLLGNLVVYLPVVGIAYLLCILSHRRQLFRVTFVILLVAFPIALSAMQLIFPRDRLIFGFSGINAGFVGLACFALAGYISVNISQRADERYAPVLFFVAAGLITLISLPARAYRFEISTASLALAVVYLGFAISQKGMPTVADLRAATDRPGYFEAAGAGFGLLVGYPFVAFQDVVVPGSGVLDVYIHLLGFSLAFIIVFAYVFVVATEEAS